jgi:hypothetical protein
MGHNKRHNEAKRREIHWLTDRALRAFYRDKGKDACVLLGQAAAYIPFNVGAGWNGAKRQIEEARSALDGPCHCWHCELSAQQRRQVRVEVSQKIADLAAVYPDERNNFTGAHAEVVFGMKFGLRINQIPGFDGGKDFIVPCASAASGEFTIDVKGTTYGSYSNGKVTSYFPFQSNWNGSREHVYAYYRCSIASTFFIVVLHSAMTE